MMVNYIFSNSHSLSYLLLLILHLHLLSLQGSEWTAKHCWGSKEPVSRWYKVRTMSTFAVLSMRVCAMCYAL
jgi:recombinational DNA repair protein (RecF pathway)